MGSSRKLALLMCGSFNPITNMHLRIFEVARDTLQKTGKYQVVEGIISPVSDLYGKAGLADSKHRVEMARLAVKSSTWLRCDDWETAQPEWSPTLQVLLHHRDMYQKTGVQLKLLCGADVLESFEAPGVWKHSDREQILQEFGVVCISRHGTDLETFIYESDQLSKNKNCVHLVKEWMRNDLSATKIRRAISRGESVKYLLQDNVIAYIQENNLYEDDSSQSSNSESAPSPQKPEQMNNQNSTSTVGNGCKLRRKGKELKHSPSPAKRSRQETGFE